MSTTIYTSNGKILINGSNNKWLKASDVDPYNPLGLPPKTIRIKFKAGVTPQSNPGYFTVTLVDAVENVWDWTVPESRTSMSIGTSDYGDSAPLEVLGFNARGITSIRWIFVGCSALKNVPLFDATDITNCEEAFAYCTKVESGALAAYNELVSKSAQITSYSGCFRSCGSDTTTGAAELAQIPSGWK